MDPQDQRAELFRIKMLVALEDDRDAVQMVVRASTTDDCARSIILDEDDHEEIVDGVAEAAVEDNKKAMCPRHSKCLQGRCV